MANVGPTLLQIALDRWVSTTYRRANVYLKRHVVRRGDKRYAYLRLVQAFRTESGTVRHRVLATLGRLDELKASGQLDQLAAAFARLDPPRIGFGARWALCFSCITCSSVVVRNSRREKWWPH